MDAVGNVVDKAYEQIKAEYDDLLKSDPGNEVRLTKLEADLDQALRAIEIDCASQHTELVGTMETLKYEHAESLLAVDKAYKAHAETRGVPAAKAPDAELLIESMFNALLILKAKKLSRNV